MIWTVRSRRGTWPKTYRSLASNGNVIVALKKPYDDGASQVVLSPIEYVDLLAALVPKPRVNLTRFHGVFSPNSRLHKYVVPIKPADDLQQDDQPSTKACSMTWAQRLKCVFAIEIELCEKCGCDTTILTPGWTQVVAPSSALHSVGGRLRPSVHRNSYFPSWRTNMSDLFTGRRVAIRGHQ